MSLKIGGFATLLQVFDMPTSLAFYRDVLGFEVVSDVPDDDQCDWVMLKLHGSELMLNTAYEAEDRPPVPDATRIAAHADTALFFDCENVDVAYVTLKERSVAVKAPVVRSLSLVARARLRRRNSSATLPLTMNWGPAAPVERSRAPAMIM